MRYSNGVHIAARCVFLFLCAAAASSAAVQTAAAADPVPGDVNGDGIINLVDVARIKDHLLERTPLTSGTLTRADANQDGAVNMADVVWTVKHRYHPTTATLSGRLLLPAGVPLDPTSLTLISPGGDAPLNASWEFSNLPVWDTGAGQFLFVEDLTSNSLLMMYVRPDEVSTTTQLVLTTTHTAVGLIAMHPACFGLADSQRRELLDIAEVHADFPDLVLMIDQALLTSPTLLVNYDSFPAIYELAGAIGNDAAHDWQNAHPGSAQMKTIIAPLAQVGRSQDPHLEDWPSHGVNFVNPHLVFYGARWGGGGNWTLILGKDGLLSPSTAEPREIVNGNYTVDIWKGQGAFWSDVPAERAAAQANVIKTVLNGIDLFVAAISKGGASIPGYGFINNNENIEAWTTEQSVQKNAIMSIFEANLNEPTDILTWYKEFYEVLTGKGNYSNSLVRPVAQWIYGISEKNGTKLWRYFSNANKWMDGVGKVLKMYDYLNEVVFFGQVFFYRNDYHYRINVNNGVLTREWSLIAPEARLTASTSRPTVGGSVNFDASATTDDATPFASLWFRFDFENDGVWNTIWKQGDATESHAYTSIGPKTCVVEVKDSDNLTARARYYLYVGESGSGTITIDVTPDTGQWRLFGPAGFTSVSGTGDRIGGSAITGAPVGSYTLLCYDNVPNYNPPAAQTKTLAAGQTLAFNAAWTDEGGGGPEITINLPGNVPLVLVQIPAGSFQMGSPDTERSRSSDEGPVHTVNIAYSFYMGKTELTQKQWLAVMGSWPGTAPSSSYGVGDNYPAYYISWNDCQNFITALNQHITNTGQGPATFRLPSEAEWEYACRAGTQTRFFFGDSLTVDDLATDGPAGTLPGNRSDYMWFGANNSPYGTKPVGTKLPNQFGLYDMSGNVWEWCQDYWHGDYTGAPLDGSAWVSPTSSYRVVRVGYWYNYAYNCRSADRAYSYPGTRGAFIGMRFVRTQ